MWEVTPGGVEQQMTELKHYGNAYVHSLQPGKRGNTETTWGSLTDSKLYFVLLIFCSFLVSKHPHVSPSPRRNVLARCYCNKLTMNCTCNCVGNQKSQTLRTLSDWFGISFGNWYLTVQLASTRTTLTIHLINTLTYKCDMCTQQTVWFQLASQISLESSLLKLEMKQEQSVHNPVKYTAIVCHIYYKPSTQ